MDKQTESREKFETWMGTKFSRPDLMLRRLPDGGYSSHYIDMRWEAWQASRKSLEVELPSKIAHLNISTAGTPDERGATYDIAIDKCAKALRAISIRIKGEGDGASS